MNVRQLEIFCTLCREGSVTKTAKALYMTQPAVTHVINALEEEAGCPLFDRISRRLYLNASGRRFQEKAEQILELFGELSVNFAESEEQTPIHLGANITIANFWLPKVWAEFSRRYPRTPVQVTVDSAVRIEEELLAYRLDFGFLEGNIRSNRLESVEFGSYRVGVYVSPAHPLALRPSCGPEELIRERLLLREKGSAVRDTMDACFAILQLQIRPAWESASSQAIVRGVAEGLGVSVLPYMMVEEALENGLVVRLPLENPIRRRLNIIWHKSKYLTENMKVFMEMAREYGKEE